MGTRARPDVVLIWERNVSPDEQDFGVACHSQHQCRLLLFLLQKRQKGFRQSEVAQVVGLVFLLNDVHVNRLRLGEVESALNARVYENAIEVAVCTRDTGQSG